MESLPYWRLDAFVGDGLSGNPAAVIECSRWPDDARMASIASETGGSATAFLVPDESGAADWQVRWFAPSGELALCGHASLAAAHVLLARGEADRLSLRTRQAGLLEASQTEAGIELGLPAIPTEAGDWPEAVECLGKEPVECYRSDHGYAVFFFAGEDEIRALTPDLESIAKLGNVQLTCTAPGKHVDVVSRVFTRAGVEDSVTGSAHAALAPLWSERLGEDGFTAMQASARGGRLGVRFEEERGRVWLTGQCATLIEGRFYLTG